MVERVSLASMLLACVPIGIDMPVPISLPGRAPVAGFAPGGTPWGVTGTRGLSQDGSAGQAGQHGEGQSQGTHGDLLATWATGVRLRVWDAAIVAGPCPTR